MFYEFGKRDYFEGIDLCFDNNYYTQTLQESSKGDYYPFTVHSNCFSYDENDPEKKEVITIEGKPKFFTCKDSGYKLELKVEDFKLSNEYAKIKWPMRLPAMFLAVQFD